MGDACFMCRFHCSYQLMEDKLQVLQVNSRSSSKAANFLHEIKKLSIRGYLSYGVNSLSFTVIFLID